MLRQHIDIDKAQKWQKTVQGWVRGGHYINGSFQLPWTERPGFESRLLFFTKLVRKTEKSRKRKKKEDVISNTEEIASGQKSGLNVNVVIVID